MSYPCPRKALVFTCVCRYAVMLHPSNRRNKSDMPKNSKIRILIADDHAILRSGLRMLIDAQTDMAVIGEAQDGMEAVESARNTKPDVVILDITMPNAGGLHAIADILKDNNCCRVLLLTMHEEPAYLRTALASGASGYVLKKS